VVTGRVTDASVVVGPAAAHFGWERTAYDELAGAMVAGHVIECGAHATGGNFSGFRAFAPDPTPLGFPLAEIAADGSSVITKHDGTGGTVTTDTVTAQLVYEVQAQAYLGPDVTARLDTVELTPDGEDRVRVSGVRGEAPPLLAQLPQKARHLVRAETGHGREQRLDDRDARLGWSSHERFPACCSRYWCRSRFTWP
jgi:hypothetical protein